MFEKKKSKKTKKQFNLPKYNLSLSKSGSYLSSASLKIENLCEILCNLEIRPASTIEESGTIKCSISSLSNKIKLKYGKYTER
jgi:hypothetical protein